MNNAHLRAETPIDALSVDGFESLLGSGDIPCDLVTGDMSPPDLAGDMWTIEDAIEHLSITRRTVLRKLKSGELKGYKVPGQYGPEWRVYPPDLGGDKGDDRVTGDMSPGDRHPVIVDQSILLVDELRKQIAELRVENQTLQRDLQGANWRNGYLESQAELKDQQIKLLTDSQHKVGWWSKFRFLFKRQ